MFSDVKPFLSRQAFRVIDWRRLAASAAVSSRPLTVGRGRGRLEAFLPPGVELAEDFPRTAAPLVGLTLAERIEASERLATLYFNQLANPAGFYPDVRPTRLRFCRATTLLMWKPLPVWLRLADDFRCGLVDVYRGIYDDDAEALSDGMRRTGLTPAGLPPPAVERVRATLLREFGVGCDRPVRFSVPRLQAAYDELFMLLAGYGIELPGDFGKLAAYLGPLHASLARLGVAVDVRGACQRSRALSPPSS